MALNGSCNCGGVSFSITGTPRSVSNCHCAQCRKQSGNVWASAVVDDEAIKITGEIRWYASSKTAKRGFCPNCGCFLFWKHNDENSLSFSLGAIDGPTGLRIEKHIFTTFKGDYYELADGVPQQET